MRDVAPVTSGPPAPQGPAHRLWVTLAPRVLGVTLCHKGCDSSHHRPPVPTLPEGKLKIRLALKYGTKINPIGTGRMGTAGTYEEQ